MLYEFRGLPYMPEEVEHLSECELPRIRASVYAEEENCEEDRYCGFCGGKLKPGTADYDEHCHQKCSI